jgi:hypothetical protein
LRRGASMASPLGSVEVGGGNRIGRMVWRKRAE